MKNGWVNALRRNNARNRVTAENVVVVYRTGDSLGQSIAEYYQSVRNIPDYNMLQLAEDAYSESDGYDFASTAAFETFFFDVLMPRYIDESLPPMCALVLCGYFPREMAETETDLQVESKTFGLRNRGTDGWDGAIVEGWPAESPPNRNGNAVCSGINPLFKFSDDISHEHASEDIALAYQKKASIYEAFSTKEQPNTTIKATSTQLSYTFFLKGERSLRQHSVPVFSLDPLPFDTEEEEFNYVKGYIDDAIAAEQLNRTEVPGLSYVGVGSSNNTEYHGMDWVLTSKALGFYEDKVFHKGFNGYTLASLIGQTEEAIRAPSYLFGSRADKHNGSRTSYKPRSSNWEVNSDETFFLDPGNDAYHGTDNVDEVYRDGDWNFVQGAIGIFAQSYGSQPVGVLSAPWDQDISASDVVLFTRATVDDSANDGYVRFKNKYNNTVYVCRINYTGAGAAEFEITGFGNAITVSFYVNSSLVGGVSWNFGTTPRTPREMYDDILTEVLTLADWVVDTPDGLCISRTHQALSAGCCFAMGSYAEPFAPFDPTSWGMLYALAQGWCLAESIPSILIHYRGFMVGDPLYRPFPSGLSTMPKPLRDIPE